LRRATDAICRPTVWQLPRAFRRRSLGPAEVVAILNAQSIPAEQLAQASEHATGLPFLPAQALLRRAAMLETRPPAKAALLAIALSAGGQGNRLTLTAQLHSDIASSITPTSAMAGEGSVIARALVLAIMPAQPPRGIPAPETTTQHRPFAFSSLLQAQRPSDRRRLRLR